MAFAAKYVDYDMRRPWFAVINLAFIQFITVILAIIPRAHYMTVARMVEVNYDLLIYPVSSGHGPNHSPSDGIPGFGFPGPGSIGPSASVVSGSGAAKRPCVATTGGLSTKSPLRI